jgi:hypothetical protein
MDTMIKPMIRLSRRTFTSLSRIASIVFVSGSKYFTGRTLEAILKKKRPRSTRVHEIAISMMIFNSYFLTTDPRGNMSWDLFIPGIYDGYRSWYDQKKSGRASLGNV